MRARDLEAEYFDVSSTSHSGMFTRRFGNKTRPIRQKTHQSAPASTRAVFRPLEFGSLAAVPDAVDAKLEVNGEGMMRCG